MDLANPSVADLKQTLTEIADQQGLEPLAVLANYPNADDICDIAFDLIEKRKQPDQCPMCLTKLTSTRTCKRFEHYYLSCPNCRWSDTVYDPRDIFESKRG